MIGNEFERLRRNILINMGGGISPISYLVKTDNSKIYFELANTPITNFGTTGNRSSSITVNGQSVVKNTIKELVFGVSYENATTIPSYFLYNFQGLTLVDLSPFGKPLNIGLWAFQYCYSLTSIDISPLTKLVSIQAQFLYGSNALTSINIGSLNFSSITVGNYGFEGGVQNVSTSKIYADTLALGNAFKAKFPNISNWTVVVN